MRKRFGDKVAVHDLSLTVDKGEVFGFLGPNGAGKTTSVKMLLDLVRPSAGSGYLLGHPIGDYAARARVGFLPEHFRFHDWLTAVEFLKLHADLYRMAADTRKQRIPELLDLVGLTPHRDKQLRYFSKGMLQRIGLAQALLNRPELVILDEPTSGLDPVGRRLVRDIIRDLRAQGATVFLNSHLLSEVEVTCDRVAFVKNGVVVRTETVQALLKGDIQVEVRATGLTSTVASGLAQWGRDIQLDNGQLRLTVPDEAMLPMVNRYLVENNVAVYALQPRRVSLEDLFFEVVGADGGL